MPSFFRNDYFPSSLSSAVFSSAMPPKSLVDSPDAPPAHPHTAKGDTSFLIFISAQALSSVGFAVSIFAIWFGWLLPASVIAPTPAPIDSPGIKKPRLPPRHPPQFEPIDLRSKLTPARRASAPVDLTPILVPHLDNKQNNLQRVYFADSPRMPIIRRNTMPEPKYAPAPQKITPVIKVTPLSSSSTLPNADCDEEVLPDFDSSPHPSNPSPPRPSCRLQKLKLGFTAKTNRPEALDKNSDRASIASTDTYASDNSTRRASGDSFVAPWTLPRHRTAPDVIVETPSPSPSLLSFARRMSPSRPNPVSPGPRTTSSAADVLSPTFLSRKSQKRVSAPIPRTSPYGAPYFAAPPLPFDNNYPAYLKTLPQFEDEIRGSPSQISDSEDGERGRARTPGIRRVNLNSSRRTVPKRRSASEDLTQRTERKS